MKKTAFLLLPLVLTACGTTYHTGRIGANIDGVDMRFVPKQAKISVDTDKKITGTAKCSSNFWFFETAPERQAYGPGLQEPAGNIASDECTAAAMYDAISKTNADVLVAPQYTTVQNGALCFGRRCLHGTTQVIVTGFSGKISSITDMDPDVVKELQKNAGAKGEKSGLSALF